MTQDQFAGRVMEIVDEATGGNFPWETVSDHDWWEAWRSRQSAESCAADLIEGMPYTNERAEEVRDAARADAELFVDEFHAPLDPAKTDWDAVAWGETSRELRLEKDEDEALWPVYEAELVAETERLCAVAEERARAEAEAQEIADAVEDEAERLRGAEA
jgi:hypothetical protein